MTASVFCFQRSSQHHRGVILSVTGAAGPLPLPATLLSARGQEPQQEGADDMFGATQVCQPSVLPSGGTLWVLSPRLPREEEEVGPWYSGTSAGGCGELGGRAGGASSVSLALSVSAQVSLYDVSVYKSALLWAGGGGSGR